MVIGLAIRQHILHTKAGRVRVWGSRGASLAAGLAALVFVGRIVGKWAEGGWVVLISFTILILTAHGLLVAPIGYRDPDAIFRIVRTMVRLQGAMGSIVEWQSLKMQGYRYQVLKGTQRFRESFGVRRPMRIERPVEAGDYDHAVHTDHPEAPSILLPCLSQKPPADPLKAEPAGGERDAPTGRPS
jgi:hypothetical protein